MSELNWGVYRPGFGIEWCQHRAEAEENALALASAFRDETICVVKVSSRSRLDATLVRVDDDRP